MLVRSEVSGVRSSWLASATSWRWRTRDASSAVSIMLNALAKRAISSSPSTGSRVRSSVRAIRSTAVVSRRTGRRPLLATSQPAKPAASTPSPPNATVTQPSRAEDPVLVVQRLCDDECEAVLLGRYGDDPVALVIDEESADARFPFALRDLELGLPEPDVRARSRTRPWPSAKQERDANVSGAQRPRLDAGLGRADQCVGAGRKMRPLHQRVVEALLHLESGGAVGGQGDEGDHQAHGHDRQQDHPAGERPAVVPPTVRTRSDREGRPRPEPAHVSFSTYPTPRTVWISRVSSPDSVLRRK